ncbi:two-component sensor histidine kinase [Rhizobium sp. SORGH_AS 787]|nr:two-component sensor histidine kinase [Rhizobium sp. SORGH_AS_0787]
MGETSQFAKARSLTAHLQDLVTKHRSKSFRWTLGAALFAIALIVRLAVQERLPPGFPFLTFFPAVIITTLICGLWPGIVSAVMSGLASWYFFIPPAYTLELTPGSILALLFYAFIVSVDIFIIHTISVTAISLRQERHALALLAAKKEQENVQLLANDAYQKEMSLELAHRMNNQLAIVQAIISQTVRSARDLSTLPETLNGRIGVLARAHDILIHGLQSHSLVGTIVKDCLALYDSNRVEIDGPLVEIGPRSSISLSLMLHELGTNAAKYGALSQAEGTVSVGWALSRGHDPVFEINWQEVGGPTVREPTRRGAGSRLILAGLGPSGTVALNYHSYGVNCRATLPLRELRQQG